jgi:hypothetical protein
MLKLSIAFLFGAAAVTGVQMANAQHRSSSNFASFAGTWVHHGGGLHISANGFGMEHYRVYVNCSANRLTACDDIVNNGIFDGGFIAFTLTQASGNTAHGRMYNSSSSWQVDLPLTATIHPNGTITLKTQAGVLVTACNPKAETQGLCGA